MEYIFEFDWYKVPFLARLKQTAVFSESYSAESITEQQWVLKDWQATDLELARKVVLECSFDIYYVNNDDWYEAEFFEYVDHDGETQYAWNALPGMIWRAHFK